jgi:hypothetical protein
MACDDTSIDLEITQGSTFEKTFFWYSGAKVIKPITGITAAYPAVVTCIGHGLPTNEVPCKIVSVKGMTEIITPDDGDNDEDDFVYALKTGVDSFALTDVNASEYTAYTSGGYLEYTPPKDLTTYEARMQIRASRADTTTLVSLTSNPVAGITLIASEGQITVVIEASATELLDFVNAVYDLELYIPGGTPKVTRIASGDVTLIKEVTRI